MKRYLVFNAKCSACSNLARSIEDGVGDKLEAISIHDSKAITLLNQAYPEGWQHAPYLVTIDEGRVRAWRGLAMTVQLGWLMGPRQAWRVWRLARQTGAALPTVPARRQFLKLGLGLGLVTAVSSLSRFTPVAFACVPCVDCAAICYVDAICVPNGCNGSCNRYRCYDETTGQFCGYLYADCCCNCLCT